MMEINEDGIIADEDIESLNFLGKQAQETADDLRVVGDYTKDVGEDYHENTAVAVQGITAGGTDSKPLKKTVFDEATITDIQPETKMAAFILFHNGGRFLIAKRAPARDRGETWSNIGGGQEAEDIISGDPYTSFVRTATREVAEEIGMMPTGAKIRGHYMHKGEGFQALNFIVDVDDVTANSWKFNLQKDELTEIKWMSMNELKSQAKDLHPAFRNMLFRFYDKSGDQIMDPNLDGPEGKLRYKQAPSRRAKAPNIPQGRLSTGEPNALYGRGLFQLEGILDEEGPYNLVGNPSTDNYMKDLFTPDTIVWYDGGGIRIPSSIFGEGRKMSELFSALFEESWSPEVPDAELEISDIKKAGDKSAINKERPEDVERFGEDFVSDSNSADQHSQWASMSSLFSDENESDGARKLAKIKPESPKNAADKRLITFEGYDKIDKSWLEEFELSEWYRLAEADDSEDKDDDDSATAVEIDIDNKKGDDEGGLAVNYDDVKNPSDNIKRVQDPDNDPKKADEPTDDTDDGESDRTGVGEDGEIDEETLQRVAGKLTSFISRSLQSDDPVKIFMSGANVVLQFNRVSNKQTVQLVIASPSAVALNVGRKTDDEAIVGTAVTSVNL